MAERYLNSSEFAARVGVTPQTVRLWDRKNWLKPHHRSPGGVRWYTEAQVTAHLSSQHSCRPSRCSSEPNIDLAVAPFVHEDHDIETETRPPVTDTDETAPAASEPTMTLDERRLAKLVRSGVAAVRSGATPEAFAATVMADPDLLRDA